jgi:hypothetical protein
MMKEALLTSTVESESEEQLPAKRRRKATHFTDESDMEDSDDGSPKHQAPIANHYGASVPKKLKFASQEGGSSKQAAATSAINSCKKPDGL